MAKETKLTGMFIESLLSWQEEGHRLVKIEIGRELYDHERKVSVWVYDYQIMAGAFVSSPGEIPTPEDLAGKQLKLKEEERKRLLKQLEALEV